MAATSSSDSPYEGLTEIDASTPELCSRAVTLSSPSASTWKVTRMRAAPATMGGMPRSSKRASERQSDTSSRSPWTTWMAMAVWPSLKVVNSWARATGMVLLRAITRSTSPPMVSRPSDSGITSSSSHSSSAVRLPASRLACMAAPSATTWSGSRLIRGSLPNRSATMRRTMGMRVAPPTMTTPLTSSAARLASRSARRALDSVRATSGRARASKCSRVSASDSVRPPDSVAASSACCASVRASRAWRAATSKARWSSGRRSESLRSFTAHATMAASKSSPPSAVSPPVAMTSNTPLDRRRMEMSNVPPPRS